MGTTNLITILFLLATLAIATPYQTRSDDGTDTNTYISAIPSFRTLTEQILRPPYVSLQTLSARDTDIPGSSMTYVDALAPTPSHSNDNFARTSTTTSTHTLPTTTVTITLLATTYRSAVHNGSVVAVATHYSSGAALPTVTLERAAPGCTAVCGEVDGEGRCREVEGCVKGEGEKFVQTDVVSGCGRLGGWGEGVWWKIIGVIVVVMWVGIVG